MKNYLHHLLGIAVLTAIFCTQVSAQALKADTTFLKNTICSASLPYVYAGHNLFKADYYKFVFKGYKNQDSICFLTLNVVNNPKKTVRIGACEDVLPTKGVTYNGITYYKPGAYQDTVRSKSGGCDTVVTVLVDSYFSYKDTVYRTYCDGEKVNGVTYTYTNGKPYLASTGKYKTYACQCDSIVYTYVTVNKAYHINDGNVTVCENSLPYNWRGMKNLFTTKDDTVRMYTKNGCDSVFTIRFTVTPSYSSSDHRVVCPDDLKNGYKYGNQVFKQPTIQNVIFKAKNGCDSVVTVKISEGTEYHIPLHKEVCANDLPFYFPTEKGIDSLMGAGRDTARFSTKNGCDSIIYLTLTVNPAKPVMVNADICDKDLPFRFADKDIFNGGTYLFRYKTSKGCDSSITLNLTVNQTYVADTNINICSDMLPFVYQGDTMNTNGVYFLNYKSIHACDSIIRVHLTIYDVAKEAAEVTVCENAFPYTFAGQSFPNEGYYTVTLKTIHGCDSIIALHIHKRLIPSAPVTVYGPDKIGKEGVYLFYIDLVDSLYPITKYVWSVPAGCTIVGRDREEDSIWVNIPENMGLNEGDITVYAFNECGSSATTVKHIKTYIKCSIRIYPNPVIVNGEVTIEFNDMVGKNIVRITDATGRILHQETFDIKLSHEEVKMPIGNFASGEYFVRVQTRDMAILKKIVVLKEAAAKK